MSTARHRKPRPPRTRGLLVVTVLLVLLAIAAAVVAALVTDPVILRGLLASVGVLVAVLTLTVYVAIRRVVDDVYVSNGRHARSESSINREVVRLREMNHLLADELARMRAQIEDYLIPVISEPDPIYPSLHLPLVRAAFADEVSSGVLMDLDVRASVNGAGRGDRDTDVLPSAHAAVEHAPAPAPEEAWVEEEAPLDAPAVDVDAGSEPREGLRVVDLSRHQPRHAASA